MHSSRTAIQRNRKMLWRRDRSSIQENHGEQSPRLHCLNSSIARPILLWKSELSFTYLSSCVPITPRPDVARTFGTQFHAFPVFSQRSVTVVRNSDELIPAADSLHATVTGGTSTSPA